MFLCSVFAGRSTGANLNTAAFLVLKGETTQKSPFLGERSRR